MFRAATSTNDSGSTGGDEASCSWLSASSDPSVPAAALTRTGGDGTTLFEAKRVMALCLLSLVSLAAGAPCPIDDGGWSTSRSKTLTGFLRPSTSAPVTPLCGGFRPGQRRELLSPRGVSYTGTSTGSSHMSSPVVVQLNHSSVAITVSHAPSSPVRESEGFDSVCPAIAFYLHVCPHTRPLKLSSSPPPFFLLFSAGGVLRLRLAPLPSSGASTGVAEADKPPRTEQRGPHIAASWPTCAASDPQWLRG